MAKKRKGPFTIMTYKLDEKLPSRTQTRNTEAEAQDLAKKIVRARGGHVEILDADGNMCWNASYSSPMPRAYPKW